MAMTEALSATERAILEHIPERWRERFLSAASEKERRQLVHSEILPYANREIEDRELDRNNIRGRLSVLRRRLAAWDEIESIVSGPVLQRIEEGASHKLLQAIQDGDVVLPVRDEDALKAENVKWFPPPDVAVFVVQHNWASALAKAEDFHNGEFRLPYSDQAFEFRISGHRLICLVGADDGLFGGAAFYIETSVGWALIGYSGADWTPHIEGTEICAPILNLVRDQIRAIAIALEAELAVTEVVRAPHKLNRKRLKAGKLPIFDHHIVHLASRSCYSALPSVDTGHTPRRLHFVRGHWRHYDSHKAWIKWHLRGNPDIGFIDKEYRL